MRRTRTLEPLCSLAATLALTAVLTPAAAVAQPTAQTTASISGQADYISPNQIDVYVTLQGTGGFGGLNVNVQQLTLLGTMGGGGGTTVVCDGRRHTYVVAVFGAGPGWQLGEALASADVFCPSSGNDFVTKTIRITKP